MIEIVCGAIGRVQSRFHTVLYHEETLDVTAPHQSTLMSVYAFDGSFAALSRAGRAQKRIFDIVLSCIIMVAVFPVLVIIAVAIKLDSSGPVLFRQTRVGLNGHSFRIYKFRTMTVLE